MLEKISFYYSNLITPDIRKIGLSQNSIIGNNLWQPHFHTREFYNSDLSDLPGIWFCRDFSNKDKPIRYGNLFSILTEDMLENSKDEFTPFLPINSIDLAARISLTDSGFLLNKGLLEWKSYEEAYKELGLFERYGFYLLKNNILDERVLMVTPKGNGRIFCFIISGNGKLKPNSLKDFQLAF